MSLSSLPAPGRIILISKEGKIAPMYIGDGYAAVETLRKAYLRITDADVSRPE